MKITKSEFKALIQEEVKRQKTIIELKNRKNAILKQLNEMEYVDMETETEEDLDEISLNPFKKDPEKLKKQFADTTSKYYAELKQKYDAIKKPFELPKWATVGTPEFENASWAAVYLGNPDIYWNPNKNMYMPRAFSGSHGSTAGESQGGRGAGVGLDDLKIFIEKQNPAQA